MAKKLDNDMETGLMQRCIVLILKVLRDPGYLGSLVHPCTLGNLVWQFTEVMQALRSTVSSVSRKPMDVCGQTEQFVRRRSCSACGGLHMRRDFGV